MNYLGKAFVFLNFVLSIAFMSLAIGVWAVNRNYFDQIKNELKPKIESLTKDRDQFAQERDSIKKQLDAETALRQMAVAALRVDTEKLAEQNTTLQKLQLETATQTQEAIAVAKATADNSDRLTDEMNNTRETLRNAELKRDQLWSQARKMTDLANQKTIELDQLRGVADGLLARLASVTGVLDGRSPQRIGDKPDIRGLVVDVRDGKVSISIGQDDGLKVGDTLEVYSGEKYLGRVRVVSTKPDGSVCDIIPGFQKGAFQRGDNVTTRFKVG